MANLLISLLLMMGQSFGGDPNLERTLARPCTANEYCYMQPENKCKVSAGCFRVENWMKNWVSPGIEGGPAPGNALVIDADGIVHGVYFGQYAPVGVHHDFVLGSMPVIQGDFRPALPPSEGGSRPTVYITPRPGVVNFPMDVFTFEGENLPEAYAYDLWLGRVVLYTPGKVTATRRCDAHNNVWAPNGQPELMAINCR